MHSESSSHERAAERSRERAERSERSSNTERSSERSTDRDRSSDHERSTEQKSERSSKSDHEAVSDRSLDRSESKGDRAERSRERDSQSDNKDGTKSDAGSEKTTERDGRPAATTTERSSTEQVTTERKTEEGPGPSTSSVSNENRQPNEKTSGGAEQTEKTVASSPQSKPIEVTVGKNERGALTEIDGELRSDVRERLESEAKNQKIDFQIEKSYDGNKVDTKVTVHDKQTDKSFVLIEHRDFSRSQGSGAQDKIRLIGELGEATYQSGDQANESSPHEPVQQAQAKPEMPNRSQQPEKRPESRPERPRDNSGSRSEKQSKESKPADDPDSVIQYGLRKVLRHEGGYVDNKNDPGGATNRGITLETFRAWRKDKHASKRELKKLSEKEAIDIYRTNYVTKPGIQNLPTGLIPQTLDLAVNVGPYRAIVLLQRAISKEKQVKQTGRLDKATLEALRSTIEKSGVQEVNRALREERKGFYDRLVAKNPKLKEFLKGWKQRANQY